LQDISNTRKVSFLDRPVDIHRVLTKFLVHEHARMTGTTIIRIAYGHAGTRYLSIFPRIIGSLFSLGVYLVDTEHDQWIELVNNVNRSLREASKAIGTHIAEVLPFCTSLLP
jgi:hypothetical protein